MRLRVKNIFKGFVLGCMLAASILLGVWLVAKIPGYNCLPIWVKMYAIPIIIGITCSHFVKNVFKATFRGI